MILFFVILQEIINEIENSLSLSKRTTLSSTTPIIDFLINEPVLIAEQELLFDLTNENEDIINITIELSRQSTFFLEKNNNRIGRGNRSSI